jgi:alpha-tubulin suppressor-like RCC1 family protein
MGQLGDGTSGTNRLTPIEVIGLTSVTQIDVGNQYSCAVNASRTTKCWGLNNSGQLGDGTTTARFSPVEVQVR